MTHVLVAFTPEWRTQAAADHIVDGLAWRVAATGGTVLDHRIEPGDGRVVALVDTPDEQALASVLAEHPIPCLADQAGPVHAHLGILARSHRHRDPLAHLV